MSIISRKKQYKVTVGMQRSWWAKIATEPDATHPTYTDVEEMGAARLGTLTYETSSTDIEGDDVTLRHFEKFLRGTFVAENTLDELTVNAKIYGHAVDSSDIEHSNQNDASPFGCYAFTQPLIRSGSDDVVWRATFLPKISANPANEAQNAATAQGGQINPGYNNITFTVSVDKTGDWRLRKEFASEALAEAWIMSLLGVETSSSSSTT